ncbi:long-chain acyl-CoA synthetase [Sporomusaceae bacterium BoRhaA]|uniref:AMP-binding protein n=1 Tax=Pelorhabdus rhamnosifermentans TaxID=2772457 RepID=UPI001C05F830|nr:AMP-binding protein [Pelorhabdus rhamnosifermentans]MBU2701811.1 long-chain acyl-CoA synthetase [Pelorhabdus rhamnosifermentans]
MLIHSNITHFGKSQAQKLCLIHGTTRLTYQELIQKVNLLAQRLATKIQKGDKVLVKQINPVSQLLYFLSTVKAGGCCIFVDASTSQEVCTSLMEEQKIVLAIDENFQLSKNKTATLPDIYPEDIFLGALSSGSTGTPRLIWRSHQSWTNAFPSQSIVFHISPKDTIYLAGSLAYTANLNACLHLLAEGGTVVMASNHLPRTWVREIKQHQVSAMFMVPAHYRLLLKVIDAPLNQITSLVTAGAKIDGQTVQNLVKAFPQANICEYYGASELGHVSYSATKDLLSHPESVGKAFPGVTLTIEQDTIWAESPYLAPEYSPKSTVGDLGKIDKEGYLYLLGRKSGIINSGGIKIIPEQLENILRRCPGIDEAVVGGITDPMRGQKVCAWIVKKKPTLLAADILDYCRQKMLSSCCPQQIIFVDEIPMNSNGKIDRIRLKAQ